MAEVGKASLPTKKHLDCFRIAGMTLFVPPRSQLSSNVLRPTEGNILWPMHESAETSQGTVCGMLHISPPHIQRCLLSQGGNPKVMSDLLVQSCLLVVGVGAKADTIAKLEPKENVQGQTLKEQPSMMGTIYAVSEGGHINFLVFLSFQVASHVSMSWAESKAQHGQSRAFFCAI